MEETKHNEKGETKIRSKRRWVIWRRFWRRFRYFLLYPILFFILLFLLLQLDPVQQWIQNRIVTTLENRLETKVSIEKVRFPFFDKLTIEGLFVQGFQEDTLLYSDYLNADFNLNPLSYYQNGLVINKVDLKNAVVNFKRRSGQQQNDFQIFLNRLFPTKKEKRERNTFQMDLRRVDMENIRFVKLDSVNGNQLSIALKEGILGFSEFDLPNKYLYLDYLRLDQPVVATKDFLRSPLAETEVQLNDSLLIETIDSTIFRVRIDNFELIDGKYNLDNYRKSPVRVQPDDVIDYTHLGVDNIQINFRNFEFDQDLNFAGEVRRLSLEESSGFKLENLTVKKGQVSSKGIQLNGLNIKTPYSEIGDTLALKYRRYEDFTDFNNRVFLTWALNNTKIALKDIIYFASGLKKNTFFRENEFQSVQMNGEITGRINGLRSKNLDLRLTDGSIVRGNFRSRNLAVKDEEFIDFTLDQLNTSISTLENLIPSLDLPENFDKLGQLNFKGTYYGFFSKFVADGFLKTDLGIAEMDLDLNTTQGRRNAVYTGGLKLIDFDLGTWLDNKDFGTLSINSNIDQGYGLTGETVNATLTADILNLTFREYSYKDATFKGTLNKNLLDGDFIIKDDNIDFTFKGQLNFRELVNNYVFDANINRLDLGSLNLGGSAMILSGNVDINLEQDTLSNLTGNAIVTNFEIIDENKEKSIIEEIYSVSTIDTTTNQRKLLVRSDIIDGDLRGIFNIEQIPDLILQYIYKNHPDASRRLGIKEKALPENQYFSWDLNLKHSSGLQKLIDPKLGELAGINFDGYYGSSNDSLRANLVVPELVYDKLKFKRIGIFLEAERDEGDLDFSILETIINEKQKLEPIKFLSSFYEDTGLFALNYKSQSSKVFDQLNLEGSIVPFDSTQYEIHLDQSNLTLLNDLWLINNENSIRLSKDSLVINNFKLSHQEQRIELKSYGQTGLNVLFNNADFALINDLTEFKPIQFSGRYDFIGRVDNLFKMQNINVELVSDTLLLNEDDWGTLQVIALANDLKSPIRTSIRLDRDTAQIQAEGFFNIAKGDSADDSQKDQSKYFDFNVDIYGFPVSFAEYFIGNTISGTEGAMAASLKIDGPIDKPNIGGNIQFQNVATTIDYLQTRYFFEESYVKVDNQLFDLTGTILRDEYGNQAMVRKGIRHNHLRDFGHDAELQTDRLLALNTQKGDNQLFYGQAYGSGLITFSGSFPRPNIYINATVGDDTKITIPLDQSTDEDQLDFIKFVNKREIRQKQAGDLLELPNIPKGVRLDMDLNITEEAAVELIFDEQAGDIIRGTGRGDLQIVVPRTGDFEMYGNYIIEQGDYLFTLYNLVNKKFKVSKGGTIIWTGDPFGARINLEAIYSEVKAPVIPLIQEYLIDGNNNRLRALAGESTDVDLRMFLQGELQQPLITFDIELPELSGRVENYAENKIDLLQRDQNEMYKQVFGLIVMGQFLPSEYDFAGAGNDIIYHTLSEFVSNQLSLLLTGLFSEFIGDNSALSGIDVDFKYSRAQTANVDGRDVNLGEELEVRLRQDFFNDRLSVVLGGNIDFGGNIRTRSSNGTFFGNDLVIEYVLSKNRNLKLKLYQRLEPDIVDGNRLQIGSGLSFRKEFDTFGEFLKSFKKDAKN